MKLLDKYISKLFIKNFAFSILCFILIFILVDLFENLDKFIDKNLTASVISQYYLYFIPEILKLITPVGLLISSLFTISRLNNYFEMTAINSSGISLFRVCLPLLLIGLISTCFALYFNGWVIPKSNSEKLKIERTFLQKNQIPGVIPNLHIQNSPNEIITIASYNELNKSGTEISIQIFDEKKPTSLVKRLDAKIMNWDSIKNEWILIGVIKREFDSTVTEKFTISDTVTSSQLDNLSLHLSPAQIKNKQLKPDEIMLTDLGNSISTMKQSGQETARAEVDYYSRISFPFANIVVILLGISLSTSRRKGGAAVQFGISIFIAFIYLGFVKVSQTFGYSGDLNPLLTAWIANIVFLLIAGMNFIRANFRKG